MFYRSRRVEESVGTFRRPDIDETFNQDLPFERQKDPFVVSVARP